ncbi:uncharacterized protein LOC135159709 isoform X2 [Lytechinus pictus]
MGKKVQKKTKTMFLNKVINFKEKKNLRNQCKYRRRKSLFNKSHELAEVTGCDVFLYVKDEFSKVTYWGTDNALQLFQPVIDSCDNNDSTPVSSVQFVTPSKTPKHLQSVVPCDADSSDLGTLLSQLASGSDSLALSDITPLSTSSPSTSVQVTPKAIASSSLNTLSRASPRVGVHPSTSQISSPKHASTPDTLKNSLSTSTQNLSQSVCTPRPAAKRKLVGGTPDSTPKCQRTAVSSGVNESPLPRAPGKSLVSTSLQTYQSVSTHDASCKDKSTFSDVVQHQSMPDAAVDSSTHDIALSSNVQDEPSEKEGLNDNEIIQKDKAKGKQKKKKDIYIVEAIEGEKLEDGEKLFYVKWKNWPRKFNTWEPEHHILDIRLLEVYYQKKAEK